MRIPFPQAVSDGGSREGIAWNVHEVNALILGGGLGFNMLGKAGNAQQKREGDYFMADVNEAYAAATDVIAAAQKGYTRVLEQFRGTIKNDLASISASAAKVQTETVRMNQAYQNAVAILTSPEMALAIENAERLSKALTAISELKSHNITFAVLDKKIP